MTIGDCDMAKKLKLNSLPRGALGKSAIMGLIVLKVFI